MVHFKSDFFTAESIEDIRKGVERGRYEFSPSATLENSEFDSFIKKVLSPFDFFDYRYEYSNYSYFFSPYVEWFCQPYFNGNKKTVSFFENQSKRDKGIRTEMKIGRFLRKFCMPTTDKRIEMATDFLCEENTLAEYVVFVGSSREDFKKIYRSKVASGGNLGDFKCINASCMRYEFHGGEFHPSEVYASGDFEIVALRKEECGTVYARAIVCTHDNCYLPVYTCNTVYGNELIKVIKEMYPDIRDADDVSGPTVGAKILKIAVDTEENGRIGYLTTYFDVWGDVEDKGDHFELSDKADHYISEADGIFYIEEPIVCDHCQRTSEYYTVSVNNVCEICGTYDHITHEYEVGPIYNFLEKRFFAEGFYLRQTVCLAALEVVNGFYVLRNTARGFLTEEYLNTYGIEECLVANHDLQVAA